MKQHDLVVIGSGPGGYVAAIRAAQLGLNVACVEMETALGGTCLRVGCIPSKALLESSERYAAARHSLAEHGVKVAGVELDLSAMLNRKEKIVSGLTKGIEALFKKNKVTRYAGRGRIAGPGRVVVEPLAPPQLAGEGGVPSVSPAPGGGLEEISAKNIIIATGSR
ncbi:MAG: FAD-dependent oxidoreductase, partial [Phycisphaerae bacterium]|nr:FAD-dependent oxidoreductase [Phycisphaerae bacterium]